MDHQLAEEAEYRQYQRIEQGTVILIFFVGDITKVMYALPIFQFLERIGKEHQH